MSTKNQLWLPFTNFRERGIEQELLTKWFGEGVRDDGQLEGNTLTLGQMGVIFIVMAVIYAQCLVVLCAEVMLQWFKRKMRQTGMMKHRNTSR